jgi:putative iron-regulated protein
MKHLNYISSVLLLAGVLTVTGCKKDADKEASPSVATNADILNTFSANISQAVYNDLAANTAELNANIILLSQNPTDAQLTVCRDLWKTSRLAWEQSEAFLFGPVATEDIDPRIDTWPVNFTSLDSVISRSEEFTDTYIDELEDALKGFHPIEYFLFGENGNKSASEFTPRQLDYLKALGKNLATLTRQLADSWNPNVAGNYHNEFVNAGTSSEIYDTKKAAFEEMVAAMAGICEEVAGGKISEPFTAQDPSLEESPFAKNSIADFRNNIIGVQNVYLGKYTTDGSGIEDLVRQYNLSLDGEIKLKMQTAIASFDQITVPFGEAIVSQPVQVQNTINAINSLQEVLETKLLPLVQQRVND